MRKIAAFHLSLTNDGPDWHPVTIAGTAITVYVRGLVCHSADLADTLGDHPPNVEAGHVFLNTQFVEPENTTLYGKLIAAGCLIDHHESDLYVLDTPDARRIIAEYRAETLAGLQVLAPKSPLSTFISQIDGKRWIDLPFMFWPFWMAASRRAGR